MLKKNKVLLSAIGLLTGVCIFSTTALVAFANTSGYERFRNSIFKTVQMKNFEADSSIEIKMKGETVLLQDTSIKVDNQKSLVTNVNKVNKISRMDMNDSMTYMDGTTIIGYSDNKIIYEILQESYSMNASDFTVTAAQQKFISVLTDTLLGDTKNFIVSEGNKTYFDLSEQQVPALAQAGINVMFEAMQQEVKSNSDLNNEISEQKFIDFLNYKNISIKNVKGNGEVDENGNMKNISIEVEIGGYNGNNEYENIVISSKSNVTKIGNVTVTKPNITEKAEDYYLEDFKDVDFDNSQNTNKYNFHKN